MKRASESAFPPAMKAVIIRVNVGGTVFATSRETLNQCGYFEPFLEGRFPHATDDNGALFLDRSPDLFKILLQFMRANTIPLPGELRSLKQDLLAECMFFQLPALADFLRGLISPHDMRPQDRALRDLERQGAIDTIDLYSVEVCERDPQDLEATILPSLAPRCRKQGGFEEFKERFTSYTRNLDERLASLDGVIFAGGSVFGAICDCAFGDIDIFLVCKLDDAHEIFETIYKVVAAKHLENEGVHGKLLVTRSKNAVTIFEASPECTGPAPIQIVLTVYASIKELLLNFDVDSCCFAYSPKDQKVWTTERGLRSLEFGANLADSAHDSLTYTRRLEKYQTRGVKIAIPGFY